MDLNISAYEVKATHSFSQINLEIEDVDESEVLNQINIDTAIEHYDKDKVLDEIGEGYVKEYFGLKNVDDE